MKLIWNFKTKIVKTALIMLMIINCNILSYKFSSRIPTNKEVNDNSSIYSAEDTVSLLINIAKKVCTKATSATVTPGDFDNIIEDCLKNLKNSAQTNENSLKNFWNICTDYAKNKTAETNKKIDQPLIESLIALVKLNRVSMSKQHVSSCGNMLIVGNYNQPAVITEVESFFSKFKLGEKPTGTMISSAIGVHRNLAEPNFFAKLNGSADKIPSPSVIKK